MNEQDLDEVLEKLKTLLLNKNKNYGDSFHWTFREYGLESACIRLTDKLNRLKALAKKEENSEETITETLYDIIGYSILTILEIEPAFGGKQ